ncbi:MAG: transketolase [Clostridia bacterium]|nr:transketolase [Clostridia bacterium]
MNRNELTLLNEKAKEIRLLALDSIHTAKSGHPGGSLSIAEILSLLYFKEMKVDPADPKADNRDRFVLSKGHGAPALYAALAMKGFFPIEELKTLRQVGSRLQGHPDAKKIPGVDIGTGSLGQGFSCAIGMALAGKGAYNVYTVLGDGELQEGQIWEGAMFINHYNVTNLYTFVDYNKVQLSGDVMEIAGLDRIKEKFESFGLYAVCCDGHDIESIDNALTEAKNSGRPSVIICDTVKGKGVSFMENTAKWHGNAPNDSQYEEAVKEIKEA